MALDTSGLLLQTIVSKEASAAGPEASTTSTWLTYRHTERLATPISRLRSGEDSADGRGSERSSASVTIGLPVPPSLDALWASKGQWDGWSSQKVYAVLPLQDAGLPVALDADWIPTSSREQIQTDDAWNQVLRSLVPRALASALKIMLGRVSERTQPERNILDSWLPLMPSHTADFFFKPVLEGIRAELQLLSIVPGATRMLKPSECIVGPEAYVAMGHPSWQQWCWEGLGRAFPSAAWMQRVSEGPRSHLETLFRLGGREFLLEDLVVVLKHGIKAREQGGEPTRH